VQPQLAKPGVSNELRNLSAWCIRNPIVPIVLFTGLMLMGIVAFSRMEIQQQPDIEFPIVIVQISQPGAAPTEIETQITASRRRSARSPAWIRSARPLRKA
jgi:Cu/Ag efflux pump CusA